MTSFAVIAIAFILLGFQPAYASKKAFCQTMFGDRALLTLEPEESNRGGVSDNFVTGKAEKITIDGLPEPTGFRCILVLYAENEKCPKGMAKRKSDLGKKMCSTKTNRLSDLCPNEIEDLWPGLGKKVCVRQSSK